MNRNFVLCVVIIESVLIVWILLPTSKKLSYGVHQEYEHVRVLCFVPCSDNTFNQTAVHVMNTWGKRCNKLIFFTNKQHKGYPAVALGIPDKGKNQLTVKMFASLAYIYKNYLSEFDWFMKADTDTFVIVENLRYMLSNYTSSKPIYFGHYFPLFGGYMSGGAGYVLSREALRLFGVNGFSKKCQPKTGMEDIEIGKCLRKLGVKFGNSLDSFGRNRFHIGEPILWKTNISNYPISFHKVKKLDFYSLEFFIKNLHVAGRH